MEIINLVLSFIALGISVFTFCKTQNIDRRNRASELVIKISDLSMCNNNTFFQKVVIKNNSLGAFMDVLVILVPDQDIPYANKTKINRIKSFEDLSIAFQQGTYKYINSVIDEEELIIRSYDRGMHKCTGAVLIFKDNQGKEWFKDTNNKLYPVKNTIRKLVKAGLPLPGYKYM